MKVLMTKSLMAKSLATISALAILAALIMPATEARADDKFQKLAGSQIRARLSGMEMTDGVHWADVFVANGTVTSISMGHKTSGKWRIEKDELCIDRGKDNGGCYQIWLSGKKIELRREGSSLPLEGVLQRQSVRR